MFLLIINYFQGPIQGNSNWYNQKLEENYLLGW